MGLSTLLEAVELRRPTERVGAPWTGFLDHGERSPGSAPISGSTQLV